LLRIRLLSSFNLDGDTLSKGIYNDKSSDSTTPSESHSYSDHVLDALQYSLEEAVSTEIENYLCQGPILNDIVLGGEHDTCGIHLPCLETVLQQFKDSRNVSVRSLEIISLAIMATNPQSKRQIARSLAIPFGQRRAQLKTYVSQRVGDLLRAKGYSDEGVKAFDDGVKARQALTF